MFKPLFVLTYWSATPADKTEWYKIQKCCGVTVILKTVSIFSPYGT